MLVGVSFSQRQVQHLGMSEKEVWKKVLEMKVDLIRLACYWNEIETQPGVYNFKKVTKLLDDVEGNYKTKIVMCVGMKAPRWPEFYIPDWLQTEHYEGELFVSCYRNFLKKCKQMLSCYKCISYWQVENEPLDPSGPKNEQVPLTLLVEAIKVVKKDEFRPVLVSFWGNKLGKRKLWRKLPSEVDEVGLDLYFKQFVVKIGGRSVYVGPHDSLERISAIIKEIGRPVWITELQAEPWEKDIGSYLSKKPKSMSPEEMFHNWELVKSLPVKAVLFWGCEYWWWQASKGNHEYIGKFGDILESR